MTEQKWLDCTDPKSLPAFLGNKVNERKLRLLACACCRRQMRGHLDALDCAVVDVAEWFADGAASAEELSAARRAAKKRFVPGGRRKDTVAVQWVAAKSQARALAWAPPWVGWPMPAHAAQHAAFKAEAAHLFRDLFGPLPFRP